ncbi:MAG: polysaccharide biosynthesis tyrosine autokinase [Acidimicrobiales bacterium]
MPDDPVEELDLRDYLRVIRRRKWTIALVTLVVVGSAIAVSLVQTPVYQGEAEVLLQARSTESLFDPETGQRNDPVRAVQTEIQVLKSRPVRDLVRKELGSAPKVSASPVGQTDVIEVRAESTDPDRAAAIANAYAESYIDFRRTQAVDDLLAAAEQIQEKITELQGQMDALGATPPTTARGGARPAPAVDVAAQRDQLLAQQALFRQKLDQLQVDAALKSGGAQLVTPAVAPSTPVRPTPVRNGVLALVVGAMLGLGVAFLREYLDDTIRTKEDVERVAGGLPVLSVIPVVPGWKDRRKAMVASLVEPKSAAAEAYRSLRTSVQFLGLDRPVRTLQVTSPSASEGKTSTVANLAVALAGAGQRVIAVDCDLRKPRLHAFFGLDNEVGFTSVLVGDAPLSEALQPLEGVDGLRLLASGSPPPNPSELLAGPRSAQVLESLAAQADVVLVDCPPVLPVTDAAILAGRVDATLVVVTATETHRRRLHQALETLAQVGAPLAGLVLNAARQEAGYGYSYRYRYGYAYGSPAEPGRARKSEQPAQP